MDQYKDLIMNESLNSVFLILLLFLLFTLFSKLGAQEKRPIFLGVQPAITKEKFYDDDEFDINIVPLVFQMPLAKRLDVRLVSVINFHLPSNQFSDIAVFSVWPIFFKAKENSVARSSGFYAGPLVGFGTNQVYDHLTLTVGIEPGYMFAAQKRFTLAFGMQLGSSYFINPFVENEWHDHFAIKINLGFWFDRTGSKKKEND